MGAALGACCATPPDNAAVTTDGEVAVKAPEEQSLSAPSTAAGVKVFGMPVSQTCMGPILVAMESGSGAMELCNLMEGAHMKPEFLAMNPFHHVPTLKDGDTVLAESGACLRYLALKYKPDLYPVANVEQCAWIDFAIDSFAQDVYKYHVETVYVVMGFGSAPADQSASNTKYKEMVDTWMTHFLKAKFVCGDSLSIADYKVVPYLMAAAQPAIASKIGLTMSDRVRQYIDDFCAAVPSSAMLKEAGGFAIAEYLKSKDPEAAALAEYAKVEYGAAPTFSSAGEVKVFGMPPSQTTMGPVLLAMDAGKGALEMCNLMEGAHMKPEFLAMNPFHHVPTIKDGDFAIGESCACLRYLAMKYKPEYYPVATPEVCARIDFAMDSFSNEVYPPHAKTVYVVMGFAGAPEDQAAECKKYTDALQTWSDLFLKDKFVCGDKLSIADFKAVPYLIAAAHPVCKDKIGLAMPERITKYIDDFCAAVPSSTMLKEAGGFAIVEYIQSKA